MCGIFGYYCTNERYFSESLLEKMAGEIVHRGPDHTGTYHEVGLGIGNNRLAIVDLATGNQPIPNENRTLWIVYNGEVYNHLVIRKELESKGHYFSTLSDTETVLHAFEEYGESCLNLLNGMFAFAVWDTRTKRLFLARDCLGIKPLYYSYSGHGFVFASEAKGVFAALPWRPEPDWGAIYRYFTFGYVPSPESPFKGIRKLPAAHYAWVDHEGLAIERWWKPSYGRGRADSVAQASMQLTNLMEKAVELEMMSDVPVGVFLSGGLDSSAVALFAGQMGKRPLHSFSIRFEESTHDESQDARMVAKYLGLRHHEIDFNHDVLTDYLFDVARVLDEPFGDSTVLPLLAVSRFAHQEVKVVLTGWGGDEILAGYPTYKAHRLARLFRRLVPGSGLKNCFSRMVDLLPVSDKYMSFEFKAKRFLKAMDQIPEYQHFTWMGYFEDEEKRRLLTPEILGQVDGDTLQPVRSAVETLEEDELISRIMHLDALFFLEGNGLFQADRMTMAASLEARVPLLNRDLVNYVNDLPSEIKMAGGKPKELLRLSLRDMLPERILNKRKKGFGPASAAWIRGPLSDTFDRLFARNAVQDCGIFVPDEIERLLQEHRHRKADHGRSLWALLSFQLWYNTFILRIPPGR